MGTAIKRREANDGCGCIRCRGIDPTLVRRSTAGDLSWSLRLFQRRPLLLILVAGLAFLWTVSTLVITLVTPVIGLGVQVTTIIHNTVYALLLVIFLRGYFGAIVANEITGRQTGTRQVVSYTIHRLVPLFLTFIGLFLILGVTLGASIVVVSILVFDLGLLGPTIFDGITPTLLFGSVLAPVFYKFWIAPDICVVGDEGPITALRSSWRITSVHWRRVCFFLVSFTVTITAPDVFAELAIVSGHSVSSIPGFDIFKTQFQWLIAVVWYCVGTQIYIRSTLS